MSESQWNSFVDEATGRTYYAHAVTGETSWELPSESAYVACLFALVVADRCADSSGYKLQGGRFSRAGCQPGPCYQEQLVWLVYR